MNCSSTGFDSMSLQGVILGNDPMLKYAWHLKNSGQAVFAASGGAPGFDLNLTATWGKEIYGKDIKVLISDDGVEDAHEDLKDNFRYGVSKDFSNSSPYIANAAAPKVTADNHGTAVAGLIAAVGDNGLGSRGVAPLSKISVANFLSGGVTQTSATMAAQAEGDFDVFNMSWGAKQNNVSSPQSLYESQLSYGARNGRGGKGSIFIKAAGNEYQTTCHGSIGTCMANSNFDADNTNPYVMMVGAVNSKGVAASYSTIGSNIWISSFGGQYGDDSPAIMTTDRTGCSKGYAVSASSSSLTFERGQNGNTDCKYSVTFNGTSAAAPLMSGVVALMLEANPSLTWRDVRYILAKTARIVDIGTSMDSHPRGTALPTGAKWDQGWISNRAGFPFHNRYGFGVVNVDAAVDMALAYTSDFGAYQETSWVDSRSGLSAAIPDNSATGVESEIVVSSSFKIQSVQLKINVTHANIGQLALELTSPSGTRSVLVQMNNALTGISDYDGEVFLSNAFYRETTQGTWKLKVIDGAAGTSGTLTGWSLNFTGD